MGHFNNSVQVCDSDKQQLEEKSKRGHETLVWRWESEIIGLAENQDCWGSEMGAEQVVCLDGGGGGCIQNVIQVM